MDVVEYVGGGGIIKNYIRYYHTNQSRRQEYVQVALGGSGVLVGLQLPAGPLTSILISSFSLWLVIQQHTDTIHTIRAAVIVWLGWAWQLPSASFLRQCDLIVCQVHKCRPQFRASNVIR
jgi:hypothetical protein